MKIESIEVKNFKVLKDIKIENIQNMAVFLGVNGAGKSTIFDIFKFLKSCLNENVKSALGKRGGFKEVISREQQANIFFEIKFRPEKNEPLVTYTLEIGTNENKEVVVEKEVLKYRRGKFGKPWKFLDFSRGEGMTISNEDFLQDKTSLDVKAKDIKMEHYKLESQDILAIKGLGQFEKFKAVASFRKLIEDWHVFDFHIDDARKTSEVSYFTQLNDTGDNIANVAKYMYDSEPDKFKIILDKMARCVPGIDQVEATETSDGRIVLKFLDEKFKDPFSSRFVSDGTIKMFSYLLLLSDPKPHAVLCVEEPENQLYPEILSMLAEEFRNYSRNGGQIFISTHSPDFLNAVELKELYCLNKVGSFTTVLKAEDNKLIKDLIDEGDKLGYLWSQGLLKGDWSK